MNWDEKAYDAAHAMSPGPTGVPLRGMFTSGAAWQRDQLRSDEAVERAAKSMYEHTMARDYPGAPWVPAWESGDNRQRDLYRAQARAAIAVLLGEDA